MRSKKVHIVDIEIIWKSINGDASEKEIELLDKWLGEDPSHRMYYEQAQRFFMKGSSLDSSQERLDNAWQRFEDNERRGSARPGKAILVAASLAAAVLFAAMLLWFNGPRKNDKAVENEIAAINPGTNKARLIFEDGRSFDLSVDAELVMQEHGTTIKNKAGKLEYIPEPGASEDGDHKPNEEVHILRVPRGGEYFMTLSDGTKVWLNAGSLIRYPVAFHGSERKIGLSGEAFFQVAKDEKKPFLITTGNQVVEVLGTSFNVTSYEEDPVIVTTLVEGRVEVGLKNNPGAVMVLEPNEQSRYSKNKGELSKRAVDPALYIAWKQGRFIFEEETLMNIMTTLSRWYDIDVVFANEGAKKFRFTGNLDRQAGFEKILKKIEKTNEIKFIVRGKTIEVN